MDSCYIICSIIAIVMSTYIHHVCVSDDNVTVSICVQYNDLMKKKKIVETDKSKISELIDELDQKKNEALQSAWRIVNQVCTDNFQGIKFSWICQVLMYNL